MTQTSSADVSPAASKSAARGTSTKRLVRGSSLLFAGRLLSKGANFAIQVMIVRYDNSKVFHGESFHCHACEDVVEWCVPPSGPNSLSSAGFNSVFRINASAFASNA